jgi:hypothetical protein
VEFVFGVALGADFEGADVSVSLISSVPSTVAEMIVPHGIAERELLHILQVMCDVRLMLFLLLGRTSISPLVFGGIGRIRSYGSFVSSLLSR